MNLVKWNSKEERLDYDGGGFIPNKEIFEIVSGLLVNITVKPRIFGKGYSMTMNYPTQERYKGALNETHKAAHLLNDICTKMKDWTALKIMAVGVNGNDEADPDLIIAKQSLWSLVVDYERIWRIKSCQIIID